MKYALLISFSICIYSTIFAQSVYDKWNTGRGGIIEIYTCGNNLCGKLVASEEPNRLDTENPDPSKRDQTLIGTNILTGFEQSESNKWADGKIYNPNTGKKYSARLSLEGNVLKVRGYKGISLFGKTVKWSRAK